MVEGSKPFGLVYHELIIHVKHIPDMNAIEARSLCKSFGEIPSLVNTTFEVRDAEIFGFLGSNGAGKSTTMMILTTLLKPTSGTASVAGYEVTEKPAEVRRNIGFVQQESAIDEYMTGRENLYLQARLSRVDKDTATRRIDDLLESTGLADRQHDAAVTYSGGMKKRLDIACGLLHRPRVLFLDEPTVGLDIQTRRRIWEHIKSIRDDYHSTVFVSTHYMEEADMLCDRIGILDEGKIHAVGEPAAMKKALGDESIVIDVGERASGLADSITTLDGIKSVSSHDGVITVHAHNGAAIVPDMFKAAAASGMVIRSISVSKPTMDDVFMSYTGYQIREGGRGE